MAQYRVMLVFGIFLLLAQAALASNCAAQAYSKACASCPFGPDGKIDQSCSGGYQSSGVACSATAHPIANAQYAAGKCPQIQSCIDELNSCKAQYSSGNDSADCQEGSVSVCFSAADSCVDHAAAECGEKPPECKTPAALLLLPLLAAGFLKLTNRI
ncbi:Uncharacterised protein [uncultured archaeon]|nr:Uncharacterised protein [uncultured archaeon]